MPERLTFLASESQKAVLPGNQPVRQSVAEMVQRAPAKTDVVGRNNLLCYNFRIRITLECQST